MKLRVLIADADCSLLASYRRALAEAGFEPVTASSGLECLAGLRTYRPCALVLDAELPWGSGAGVLALMREQAELASMPVLILSNSPERLDDSVLPTMDYALLSKPIPAATVVDVVWTLTRPQRLASCFHLTATSNVG